MVRRWIKCEALNLVDTPAGLRAFPRDLKQKRPDLFIIGWHVDLAAATSTWHVLLLLMSWCRLHEIHLNILTSLSDILTTKAFPLPHIFKHVWARRSSDSVVSARLNSKAKMSLTWNHSHEVAAVSCLATSWFDSCLAASREVKKSYRLCCICREVATFSLEQPYSCHLTHTLKVSKACQIHSIMRCLHILSQMDLQGSVCQMSRFHASGNNLHAIWTGHRAYSHVFGAEHAPSSPPKHFLCLFHCHNTPPSMWMNWKTWGHSPGHEIEHKTLLTASVLLLTAWGINLGLHMLSQVDVQFLICQMSRCLHASGNNLHTI